MQIEISINCETEQELLNHLSAIRLSIKREIRKQKGEFKTPATLEGSNCYGEHTINIIPECTEVSGCFPDGNGFCLSCGKQLTYG